MPTLRSRPRLVAFCLIAGWMLGCCSTLIAAPPDRAEGTSDDGAGKPFFQTDFSLSIDGQFVLRSGGLVADSDRGQVPSDAQTADSDRWISSFSTHQSIRDNATVPGLMHLVNRAGESFTVFTRKGNERWQFEGIATPSVDGKIAFKLNILHNDALIGQPSILAQNGVPTFLRFRSADSAPTESRVRFDFVVKQVDAVSQAIASAKPEQALPPDSGKPAVDATSQRMKPPKYPPAAVREHVEGDVMVNVLVDTNGVPYSVEVVGIEPPSAAELGGAALVAALQWRYKPGTRDGKPTTDALLVPVNFHLSNDDGSPMTGPDPLRPIAVSYRKLSAPLYPAHAVLNQISGKVFARLLVAADGSVSTARVEQIVPESVAELGEAALAAIRTWQFAPQMIDGIARACEVRVPFEFRIDEATPADTRHLESALDPIANTLQTIQVLPASAAP